MEFAVAVTGFLTQKREEIAFCDVTTVLEFVYFKLMSGWLWAVVASFQTFRALPPPVIFILQYTARRIWSTCLDRLVVGGLQAILGKRSTAILLMNAEGTGDGGL